MEDRLLDMLHAARQLLIGYVAERKLRFVAPDGQQPLKLDDSFRIGPYRERWDATEEGLGAIHGGTMITATEWVQAGDGVRCATASSTKVHWVEVRLRSARRDGAPMPPAALLHTFLHELAHTVTLPERRTAVPDGLGRTLQIQLGSRLDAHGRYFAVHHPPAFYANYAQLLRAAHALNLLLLPSTARNFTPRNLQRYDALLDPNDGISLGTSPRFDALLAPAPRAPPHAPQRAPLREVQPVAAAAGNGGAPSQSKKDKKKEKGKRMSKGRR